MKGKSRIDATMTAAKTRKVLCHVRNPSIHSATGAPTIWPPLPAAETMASDIERFSSEAARPTTARITPKPVPATPNPTSHA